MRLRSLPRSVGTIVALLSITTAASVHAGYDPDHFFFYSTDTNEGAAKFVKFGPVHLVDQFGSGDYEVQKPIALGLPTDKNAGGVADPDTHLQEFAVKAASGTGFDKRAGIRVANQCNDLTVDVVKPVSLLVPSTKRLQAPAGPVPSGVDHYLCYQVKATLPKGMQVEASDQFQSRRYDLKKLTKLCLPVNKSGNPVQLSGPNKGDPFPITVATVINPTAHLLCYQAKAASTVTPQTGCVAWRAKDKGTKIEPKQEKHSPRLDLFVTGQFGTEELDTKKEVELCIPSFKNPVCGDGITQPTAGEQCDDGNTNDGDGCSAHCLTEIVSPANETLTPCEPNAYSDFWTFDVTAGQQVVVRADTTAASTAADLFFDVDCPDESVSADDEVDCTFPPPAFRCPQATFTAPATGTCTVQVRNFETCASNTSAAYSLTVTRDTVPARIALRDDDACGESCAEFVAPGTYPFTVPKKVDSIIVDVFGAQGGMGHIGGQGGRGGRTVTRLPVTPGEMLQINVGGRGGDVITDTVTPGAGGSNGGGAGGSGSLGGSGGGGGGASDVRQGGTTLADRAVVAGGGGGSGGGTSCCGGVGGAGGAGGGTNGDDGTSAGGVGGGGATDIAGGMAGSVDADDGMPGLGGAGANGDGAGGGGGGGLFGGGGGAGNVNELGGGGGGGGSGSGPVGAALFPDERVGHGLVRIIVH